MFLNYFALALLFVVGLVIFYGIIVIHDIPYQIAEKRQHPHREAIHVAGWVSLFTLHIIWPFLWIWAVMYQPGKGWAKAENDELERLQGQLAELEKKVAALTPQAESVSDNKE